jgi:F-type H+-transporting ATPase subunit delta
LFEVTAADSRAQVDQELTAIAETFAAQTDLQAVFANPSVAPAAKQGVVQAVIERLGLSTPVARLLTLLAQRDRLGLLSDAAVVFHERLLEDQQVLQAEVTTAEPLSDAERQALQVRLSAATQKHVTITPRVDPAIIGGLVARIGGTVYDGSLVSQLARIRERLSVDR